MVVVSDSGEFNITGDLEATAGLRVSNNNRQKLRQRFDILRKLGQGTYGKVQLALNKDTGEEVAIKTIKKAKIETEQDLIRIQREIQIMSSVRHPHIIHIYEVFENKEKIVLVMEYANGGELYDYLSYKRALDDCDARRLFRQIVSAVYYCHKNKICHRDLKLENILLDEKGNAKIADFGLSNVFDEKNMLNTFCGSPLYASPEIVKGTPYYGPEVDCWSLGVLLYTLVYGAMPFDGSNFRRLVKQISEGDYYEPKQPSEASSLIRRMLTVTPSKRASVEEVCTDWWVNLGHQDSLLTVAEEMCQAMPVRLDYLLQLVPPTIPPPEAEDKDSEANKENVDMIEAKEIAKETGIDKNEASSEQSGTKFTDESKSSTSAKKHDLSSSMKSMETDSADKIGAIKKKKKKTLEKEPSSLKEVKEAKPTNAMEEGIPPLNQKKSQDLAQATACSVDKKNLKSESTNVDRKNSVVEILEAFSIRADNNSELQNQQQQQTDKSVTKVDKLTNNQNSNIAEITKSNDSEPTNVPEDMEVDTKAEIVDAKKTAKSKDNMNGTNKSANELSSQPLARRGSKTIEEKKLLFSAPKVSEARKAFEAKPTEKKSLVVPGLKVSVARKAFESSGGKGAASKSAAKLSTEKPKETEAVAFSKDKSPTGSSSSKFKESSSAVVKTKPTDHSLVLPEKLTEVKAFDSSAVELASVTIDDSKSANKLQENKVSPSKEINLPSGQQKVTGFVPTLDVSMAVKPPKKSSGKPPAGPRASADSSTPSSSETTPESTKVITSPLVKSVGRRTSLTKTVTAASGESSAVTASVETENGAKKSPTSSSKDICGSESSFLARAFLNKSSENTATTNVEKSSNEHITSSSPTKKAEKSALTEVTPVKVSTVEIHLNPKKEADPPTATTSAAVADTPLKLPPKPGKFMLLGVKSEVSFAMEAPSDDIETVLAPLPPPPQKHQSLYMNVTLPPPPPATPSPSPESEHPPSTSKFASSEKNVVNVEANNKSARERVVPVQVEDDAADDAADDSRPGYSVYRSKFHSTHSSRMSNLDQPRAPSLERSESLSSTGSTDDLEDMFDNLTSDSMLSGILNRTRTIIEELTRDSASRQFSTFFSGAGGGSGLSGSSRLRSLRRDTFQDPFSKKDWFSDFTSGIGSSRFSKDSMLDSFLSRSRNVGTSSWRSSSNRMSPEPDSYLSDSGSGGRSRRNRSSSNRTYDDDYMSDSGSRTSCSNRRSAFSASSRSMSNSISEEENLQSDKRYVNRTNSLNEGASSEGNFYSRAYGSSSRRDSTSSTSSMSSQRQSWNKTPTSSWQSSSSRSTATNLSQEKHMYNSSFAQSASEKLRDLVQNRRTSEGDYYQGHRSRSRGHSDSPLENFASLCGTIRRPRSLLRYTKSMTKDLSADEANEPDDTFYSDLRRRRMHRPRSILVLADPDDDAKDEDDSSTSSDVSHERYRYPRDDISRGGGSASGRGNSRRDGPAGGAGSSSGRSNYTFVSLSSKGSGYGMHDDASTVQDHAEHQKSPVDGTDKSSSSSAADSGVYSLSNDFAKPDSKETNEQANEDNKTTGLKQPVRKISLGSKLAEELDALSTSEAMNGAAGYWAKRYGSTCRNSLSDSKDGAADFCTRNGSDDLGKNSTNKNNSGRSYKYDEKWVGVDTAKNEEKADLKKDLSEDTLVGYARSVSVELDQLQSRLNQRFDRDIYRSPISYTGRSRSLTRRLSLSRDDSCDTRQRLTRDKIGPELISENSSREDCKIGNSRNRKTNNLSNSKPDPICSPDSTPTSTPTPTPASVANTPDISCPEQNKSRTVQGVNQEERYVPSENDDSSSEALDSSATGRGSNFEEESVSERIRRKSYFARFQDSRLSRKHHDQHRKSLDINRNHYTTRFDDFSTLKSPAASHSHIDYSRTGSLGRRNSLSHAFLNDDFSVSPPSFMSVQEKAARPCRNGMVRPEISKCDKPASELQNGSGLTDHENHTDLEENGNHVDRNRSTRETSIPSSVTNGYTDMECNSANSSEMSMHGPRFSRHLSLMDNGISKVPAKVSNGNGTSHQDRYSSSSPLDASSQSRVSSRNRHDYIINRALSSLDDSGGVMRPFSPPSRLSITDHLPDLRQFSAILDNSSPRDLLRKALDVCNSLQY